MNFLPLVPPLEVGGLCDLHTASASEWIVLRSLDRDPAQVRELGDDRLAAEPPVSRRLDAAERHRRLLAGGDGASILVSEDLVWRVVADNPLGSQMRPMLDRTLVAPVDRMGGVMAEIDALFKALARETREPGAGAAAMSGFYLGLVVMHLWRACGLESGTPDAATPTVQRFRQLVELHYRDNLGVEDFCRMLNVTRAHLHNACVRTFDARHSGWCASGSRSRRV
jgi:hypothetical protein